MDFLNFFEPDRVIENIAKIVHCPFCAGHYQPDDIHIMARLDTNYVAHLLCTECGAGIMAGFSHAPSSSPKKPTGRLSRTDVKIDEMMEFVTKGSIDTEDMLNFYQTLGSFDGNFKKLYKVRRPKNHK
ncbi:MAG: hypothetical protein WC045_02235 [Patescibacteria group bacterium]